MGAALGVGWESETQDLPFPRDCPLPTAGIWGKTFQKSLALLSDGSLCGQRRELTDGLWIRAYDKVTEGGFVLKCLLLNISMKARHVPVACNQIADSPSLPFPAIPARVTGTGGESSALPRLDAPGCAQPSASSAGRNTPCFPHQGKFLREPGCLCQSWASLLCSANVTAPLRARQLRSCCSRPRDGREARAGGQRPHPHGVCVGVRSVGDAASQELPGELHLAFPTRSVQGRRGRAHTPQPRPVPRDTVGPHSAGCEEQFDTHQALPQPSGSCKSPIWCEAGRFQLCVTLDSTAGRAHCRGTVRNRHESEVEI